MVRRGLPGKVASAQEGKEWRVGHSGRRGQWEAPRWDRTWSVGKTESVRSGLSRGQRVAGEATGPDGTDVTDMFQAGGAKT